MATSVRIIISSAVGGALRGFAIVGAAIRGLIRQGAQVGRSVAPYVLMAGKVAAIGAAALAATGVLSNMLGIIQLAAPAAVAAGAAMAVFKLSLNGVEEALKAGMDGDVEKLNEALKKLSPSAKSTVLTLLDLRREWKSTQQAVQESFFKGFRQDVIAVSRAIQPIADKWLPKMAQAFGAARFSLAQVLTASANSGQLDKILAGVTGFFQNLTGVVQPLVKSFLTIAEVAAPKFAQLGEVIARLASSFRDWIDGAKESGQLTKWLDKAWETFSKLWEVVKNLGTAIAGIFRASSGGGESFLDSLVKWTQDLSDWVNSGDGQKIIEIFSKVISFLGQMTPILGLVLEYLTMLARYWGFLWEAAKAAWEGIVVAAKTAIMMILEGFGMLINGAAKAFGWMPGIGDKLKAAAASFESFKNSVNNSLNGIKKTVDITVNYRARLIGNHLVRGDNFSGDYRGGGGYASGGHPRGLSWVGEYGPELVDFGADGRVFNSGQSKKMAASGGGWSGGGGSEGMSILVAAAPGSATSALAQLLLKAIRDRIIVLKVVDNRVVPA